LNFAQFLVDTECLDRSSVGRSLEALSGQWGYRLGVLPQDLSDIRPERLLRRRDPEPVVQVLEPLGGRIERRVPGAALLRWRGLFTPRLRALLLVVLGSLLGGWAWDALSVRLGIWFYAPNNILGLWLLGLPLEEWLWIVGVTLLFALLTIVLVEGQAER